MKTKTQNLIIKPPVVVLLGHIDHGKSSLLQSIKELGVNITGKEAGGITQHIGAYQVERGDKKITFIDTPGHEAFSAMRSRGAKVADIAVLVIDAAEGTQPQTREAISHIKKTQIPFIVALNKTDKAEADPERVKRELQKEGILVEDLGGKIPAIATSAKTGQGIEDLLEMITLLAEMENLQTDISKPAEGVVIESYLDSHRGATATLILNQGVLRPGDIVGTPTAIGKIKILENFQGKTLAEALPSQPAVVIGLETVPRVGENFKVFSDIESAKKYFESSKQSSARAEPGAEVVLRQKEVSDSGKVLNLILKTDVLGSIEAIEEVLRQLPQEKVILRILKSEVGEINESDIKLARSGRAVILGFRVKTNLAAKQLAERDRVKIMNFEIIYDLVEGMRNLMEKMMGPETIREELGKVKVLAVFRTEKNRQIVGGKVIEGEIKKGAQIEVLRNEELVGRGKMINLQRNKKDIERAAKGEECGILYGGDTKIQEDDILVIYTEEKRRGVL